MIFSKTNNGRDRLYSGMRNPGDPPSDASGQEVAMHYLKFYENEFSRTRQVVKGRARGVVVATSILTALIAVIGAATSVTGWAWLGILSAAVAGTITVLERWDAMFKHRELWVQRSMVLSELQRLRRKAELWRVSNPPVHGAGEKILEELDTILGRDFSSWIKIRDSAPQRAGGPAHTATGG